MLVMLVAGEASGDKLGAALMAGLKQLVGDVEFAGVGGAQMQAEGLVSMFPMQELSVMGIAEVLPKYRQLKRRITEVADEALRRKPDVLITIDSPDFCLRVAKRVKASSDIRTVHYVAPSVWAWRPGRAVKMARHIDQVLALLPFEPPFMEAAGMRCDFVGHPVVAELLVSEAEKLDFRTSTGLGTAPVLLVLPGSRRSEVQRLTPVFGEAVQQVLQNQPDFRVLIPAAPHVIDLVKEAVANWPGQPVVLDPSGITAAEAEHRKRVGFGAADIALAASGTVSLELAAAQTPMVIAYDLNWLSWQIMSRMSKIDTVTLVNLVTDSKTVPEFLGPNCMPDKISAALSLLHGNHDDQLLAMKQTMQLLGQNGESPGIRAAHAVLDGLKKQEN